jgi:hypothetical protein
MARTPATFFPRSVGCFMSANDEIEGKFIKTVLSKEIVFDDKTGRFFETKLGADDDTIAIEGDIAGPFSSNNPFEKPKGTFFNELFSKKEEAVAPLKVTPVAPSSATGKASASPFDSFFQKKEAEPTVSKNVEPKQVSPAPTTEAPTSFFDNIFKPKEEEATSFFDIFKPKENQVQAEPEPVYYDPVTISPDFRVAAAFLAAAFLLDNIPYIQLTLGPIVTLLGLLFLVQTFRVRFVFNEKNQLEIATITNILTGELSDPGENVVVGGANAWGCDTIVNYEFFPAIDSSPVGPILVYFKETQTDKESWNEGPGNLANSEDKVKSGQAVPGQVHFFPAVCSTEQIRDEFKKRGCGKVDC